MLYIAPPLFLLLVLGLKMLQNCLQKAMDSRLDMSTLSLKYEYPLPFKHLLANTLKVLFVITMGYNVDHFLKF